MGTYIWIEGFISYNKKDEQNIIKAVHDLNKHDDLKRGGDGQGNKWFSWVPENYEGTVKTVEDIFDQLLHFEYSKVDLEDTVQFHFNNGNEKWGQHEMFFVAMAPHLLEMQVDHTCEELDYEDQKWRITIDEDKNVHQLEPVVTVAYPNMSNETIVTLESYNPYA